MHYSPVATRKYRRAYRLWQIKQTVSTGTILLLVGGAVTYGFIVFGTREDRPLRDAFGVPLQNTTTTITAARTIKEKTGPLMDEVTFASIGGRTFTWRFFNDDRLFTPGKRVHIHYWVGHSGDIYVKDAEPLP